MIKKLTLLSLLVIALAGASFAQTALTQTRLSSALTSSSGTTLVLASATGVTANTTMLYIDKEAFDVRAVSGTTITVVRGYNSTIATPHISGATVLLGPYNAFYTVDPAGACTTANTPYTPYVNIKNGYQWLCSTVTLEWVPGFRNNDRQPGVTTAVASAAGQVTPSGQLFHITGALAITGFTSQAGMGGTASDSQGANFCVIPDGAFTTTATNNIALASTGVVNKLLCFVFDGTNKKYVPSY